MKSSRNPVLVSILFIGLLILTLSLFMILGTLPLWRGHWSISLASLLLAEFAGYIYLLSGARNSKQMRHNVPGYIVIGTVIGLYIVAVIFDIVLFWFILNVSAMTYLYIQIITASLAMIGIIVAVMTRNYISDQDKDVKNQNELMKQVLLSITAANFDVSQRDEEQLRELHKSMTSLEDKVKYSDPVGHPSLIFIEESMLWQANELQKVMHDLNPDSSGQYQLELPRTLIASIMSDLHKRNQKLLMLK